MRGAVLGGVALTVAGGLLACRASLSAAEVERRVLVLDKNAPLRDLPLQRRTVTVEHEGAAIRVELVALRTGTPVAGRAPALLVHGTPGTLAAWVDVVVGAGGAPGLAAEREVVLLEVPGHGFAPGAVAPFSFALGARLVARAAEAFGLPGAHLIGHSYGGELAWRAALDRPDLFASLVLIDSSGLPRAPDEFLPEEVAMREHPLARLGWVLNSPARVRTALAPHFRELPEDVLSEFVLSASRRATWHAMVDLARDENGTRAAELDRIAVPTLLVWGEHDLAYPPERFARGFEDRIPGARLEVVPGAGHYPHQERPADVVERLRRFLAGVEAGEG